MILPTMPSSATSTQTTPQTSDAPELETKAVVVDAPAKTEPPALQAEPETPETVTVVLNHHWGKYVPGQTAELDSRTAGELVQATYARFAEVAAAPDA